MLLGTDIEEQFKLWAPHYIDSTAQRKYIFIVPKVELKEKEPQITNAFLHPLKKKKINWKRDLHFVAVTFLSGYFKAFYSQGQTVEAAVILNRSIKCRPQGLWTSMFILILTVRTSQLCCEHHVHFIHHNPDLNYFTSLLSPILVYWSGNADSHCEDYLGASCFASVTAALEIGCTSVTTAMDGCTIKVR